MATPCPACDATEANTRHARLCHHAGAQVNQHQPLVRATSHFVKRMSVRHQVESGVPFNADMGPRMDIVIKRGGHRDASTSAFRHKILFIGVQSPTRAPKRGFTCVPEVLTETDQLRSLLRRDSATTTPVLDMCLSTSAAINLTTLRWKALSVSAGKEANSSFSWRRVIGGRDGGAMPKKDIC